MATDSKKVREPIATWWRINDYRPEIEPVRVVAFTSAFVTVLEKRWTFSGPYMLMERRVRRDDILPTFAEAKAEMIRRAEARMEAAKMELHHTRTRLGQAKALNEPEEVRDGN